VGNKALDTLPNGAYNCLYMTANAQNAEWCSWISLTARTTLLLHARSVVLQLSTFGSPLRARISSIRRGMSTSRLIPCTSTTAVGYVSTASGTV